jgi:two-component system, chemotaxis family, chemotaxis protein CheY
MDALEKLPTEKIDLVITDLNMPNMDGYEFIKTLRESDQYRELPVIILSSLSDQVSRNLGLKAGAHSYLVKPFSIEKVQYEVSKYVSWVEAE